MPRIDPIQLLNCLSVLLSPNGGIKSTEEVQRLASLMCKFSKKLVSKCIYIQILKRTETELLGLFMGSGGWRLAHVWLTEGIVAKNWPLTREILELLLLCPVNIERLKTNNCPKLVKELSKDGNPCEIMALASKLVEQWLKTVKGEKVEPILVADLPQIVTDAHPEIKTEVNVKSEYLDSSSKQINGVQEEKNVFDNIVTVKPDITELNDDADEIKIKEEMETLPVLKICVRDGKQVVSQLDENDGKSSKESSEIEKSRDKHTSKNKEKSHDRSSSSSKSSKHSSKSHSSSSDKHKSSHRSSSSSRHSSKDRSRDKDKHSSSSKSKESESSRKKSSDKSGSSSSKSKDDKNLKHTADREKGKRKDERNDEVKETSPKLNEKSEDKTQPPSIHKLGKIPKLSDVKKEKPSISIEVRKPDEPKPKTVKTFHSKFRKHGLEEEVKPPPSRAFLQSKKPIPVLPTMPIPKRSSPVHNETPPEKKPKTIETNEKPGAIKLIPAKPKPMLLLESDMFMDALTASATNKKEPKKRKRRTSGSKDGSNAGDGSPPQASATATSPSSESKSVPPRFYQDTLDTEENKEKASEKQSDTNESPDIEAVIEKEIEEKMDTTEPHTLTVNGIKGVLCYHKKKGPKKSIKWKPDSELEEIQYFELDETERVNVTKTFSDMKNLERCHERESFQKARNLSNDDIMEEKTSWKPLILVEAEGQVQVEHGKNSKEKDIQAIRQKGTLQPLYFHKSMIPDSALEPEAEAHTYVEPTIIPLEDVTGNQDNISDFRNMPWPEPKGNAPPASSNINVPAMFSTNMAQFPGGFPPAPFPGVPGFQGPAMVPAEWHNGVPPHMMANGVPGSMPPAALAPGAIPPGNLPPGMMVPENMMMGPDMFGPPNSMYPVPPEGFNMQPNMFPMDFNMAGPQGPPPGSNTFGGPNNFRGPMRGRGSSHWRGKGTGSWEGPPRGRGGHSRGGRKAVCMYFQKKGSCRQGDNCTFLHPGVNCPY